MYNSLKTACKRLYFNNFKEQLVHFNGTVVMPNYLLIFLGFKRIVNRLSNNSLHV